MTNKHKHTPVPWKAKKPTYCSGDTQFIFGIPTKEEPNGKIIAAYLTPADAAFIIQCCNNHYELLEACKELSDWLDKYFGPSDTRAKIKQAIAKAEDK